MTKRRKAGHLAGAAMVLLVLASCIPEPGPVPPPPSQSTEPVDSSAPETPEPLSEREQLYRYCDQAVEQDPKCWSSRFGNDLRAQDASLRGEQTVGGQERTEVLGAGGLTDVARVGIDVDSLPSQLPGIDWSVDEDNSRGDCHTLFDATARLGVVTVHTETPRMPVEAVQAYIIENPVFRIGRSLAEAEAGLGAPGIGLQSSLDDLEEAYPDLRTVGGPGGTIVTTPVETAEEELDTATTDRGMVFFLGPDGRVERWTLGVPQYAFNLCG